MFFSSCRTGMSLYFGHKGPDSTSRISVLAVESIDSGNYTCMPEGLPADSVEVYVIHGKGNIFIISKLWIYHFVVIWVLVDEFYQKYISTKNNGTYFKFLLSIKFKKHSAILVLLIGSFLGNLITDLPLQ